MIRVSRVAGVVARLVLVVLAAALAVWPFEPRESVQADHNSFALQKGQHALTVNVDARNQVAEPDEDDNKKTINVTCKDEDN